MSGLWTPSGEHPLPDDADDDVGAADDGDRAAADEAVLAELAAARARVAAVPAAQVVANHAMGLFELAAIHLGEQPPHLDDARLAIDALGALVEGLGDRLGDAAPTLTDALAQIRLAFVQVKAGASS